jgi:hypothetical protein
MSLITNIIHDEFSIFVANKPDGTGTNTVDQFERVFLNEDKNIMLAVLGSDFNKVNEFTKIKNYRQALEFINDYVNENSKVLELWDSSNSNKAFKQQQMLLSFYDESIRKFCSYSATYSNMEVKKDIKGSVANRLIYCCIGNEFQQMNVLFQLPGIQKTLQNFTTMGYGINEIDQLVQITSEMYDVMHLFNLHHKIEETFFIANNTKKIFEVYPNSF